MTAQTLFPLDLPEREWTEFAAEGYPGPVSGLVHLGTRPPDCGLPLGGVGAGCLDLEADGTLGLSTVFNSLNPRRGPLNLPLLGLSLGLQTWILTTRELTHRRGILWMDLCRGGRKYQEPHPVKQIHYWGHYPVADLEFVSDAPVTVGMRAWAPFIPGDVAASTAPGTVFEVHLRNHSGQVQKGTLAFSFPGPTEAEAGTTRFTRRPLKGKLRGLAVSSQQAGYALGVLDEDAIRSGGDLGVDGLAWACIEHALPLAEHQAGTSLAVDFTLEAGESRVVRFVLAWHCPEWRGSGSNAGDGNTYRHMYAARFKSAAAVAAWLARHHRSLLTRVLAWQAAVYAETGLPVWLRDALINILHLIPETAVWGQAKPPIGEWCRPEDGIFALNESPRWCPQMECIPCSFYGNLPLVYLFPELALSTLRAYKAYQYPSGAAPWVFGGVTTGTPPYELALPSPGYASKPQTTLDGPSFVEMVDKLWQRTGDLELLREFYDSVKRNTVFTMNLRPGSGPAGIVSMPAGNQANDWFEFCELFGIVPHIGGAHLAQLLMARRMAEAMGDDAFAGQCREWLEQGSAVLEEHAWAGTHYLLFNELETGKRSDVVMGYQLDGEWMARFHGLEGVFRPDRVDLALQTLEQTSLAMSEFGAVAFCKPGASALTAADWSPGYWGPHGVHPPGTFMLAMTYLYRGRQELGLDLARRTVQEVVRRGWYWDWPVLLDGTEGPRTGFDYYQNLMLWSLAAAARGEDLTGPCRPGGLVDRMIRAAGKSGPGQRADRPVGPRKTRPRLPERLLFLGNSITWHGPSEDVTWTGDWGMAASALDRDYVHRVAAAVEARSGGPVQVTAENIADFERGFATWDDQARLARWRAFEPDLVVLAIGENVAAFEDLATQEQFRDRVVSLLEALTQDRGRPDFLVRSCFWPEPVRDGLLHQACARVGGAFVDIGSLSQDESSFARSEREYVHAGVGAHPGDRGMQRLADLLLAALGIGSADPD